MWFNKKKEDKQKFSTLPNLPELPDLPETRLPEINPITNAPENLPSLPSFPNSDAANRMSREVIKSALTIEPVKKPYTKEIDFPGRERWIEERSEPVSQREEFDVSSMSQISQLPVSRAQEKSPIFVRIDKFQAAAKTINEIRRQIVDIESALADIRKLKAKEEQELTEWEHEILNIKTKIDSVGKVLFSRLE